MIKKAALLLCVWLFVFGCSKEFKEDFKKLFPLRNAVMQEFGVKDVRVIIQNGHCIGVSFINSKYNGEPETTQNEVRQKTLAMISATYQDNDEINMAWISFVVHKRYFFVFNFTDSLNTKFYKKGKDGFWVNT